jgi:hypothetical protein
MSSLSSPHAAPQSDAIINPSAILFIVPPSEKPAQAIARVARSSRVAALRSKQKR